jgi:hypothetical protein
LESKCKRYKEKEKEEKNKRKKKKKKGKGFWTEATSPAEYESSPWPT